MGPGLLRIDHWTLSATDTTSTDVYFDLYGAYFASNKTNSAENAAFVLIPAEIRRQLQLLLSRRHTEAPKAIFPRIRAIFPPKAPIFAWICRLTRAPPRNGANPPRICHFVQKRPLHVPEAVFVSLQRNFTPS